MTDNDTPPPLDNQRALTIAAFVALIDARLSIAAIAEPTPFRAAAGLLTELDRSGLAVVNTLPMGTSDDMLRLAMFGVSATATGTANAVLRNWQSNARHRLSQGGRR